ncbi:hypothetical protein QBC47DRAFT_333691 [Echria macrotheca]|uniref:Uncharacterized protein n=1 Tax=Echria macrotheca TaxID=438768 RepID=A0AAJ0B1F5_9PEZI|nr:hypothetical protein QBC47DRAFT_333691 [Echria macrotheca]
MAPTSAAGIEGEVQSQYHHFVPRFILNNFSHPFKHPQAAGRRKQRKWEWDEGKFIHKGDKMLNTVTMSDSPPSVKEAPVKYSLGVTDMYRNLNQAGHLQHKLEEELSKLESRAGEIYHKVKKAFDNKEPGLWLTRDERDKLRKFLFIMKYRGPTFYHRYNHESIDSYFCDDKVAMRKYMEERGFSKPLDVWYHNMDTILNLSHDLEGTWQLKLTESIYPTDARWYIQHTEMMYLAICTPKSAKDEFILTSQCFNVYEGPQNFDLNLETGEIQPGSWTNYHEFAPVSERLIFILRSSLLPLPEEDAHTEIKAQRERFRKQAASRHADPGSSLEDLLVTKAQNSYSQIVDGRAEFAPGEDGSKRRHHKFLFTFFPIDSIHVNKINSFFFENIKLDSTIVYRSKKAFTKTLEWYITLPVEGRFNVKFIPKSQFNERLRPLQRLHALLQDLGVTDQELVWKELAAPEEYKDRDYRLEKTFQALYTRNEVLSRTFLEGNGPGSENTNKSPFIQLYMSLGGTAKLWAYDDDQCYRMKNLRIKIDVWSKGVAEDIRHRNREILGNSYMSLPSQRVWLYLQLWNTTRCHDDKQQPSRHGFDEDNCPENLLARSRHLFTSDRSFNIVMYAAHLKFWTRAANPGVTLDSCSRITLDEVGHDLLQKIKLIAFQPTLAWTIRTCGIPEIEALAGISREIIHGTNFGRLSGGWSPFFTEEENLELCVRFLVREGWESVMGIESRSPASGELKALFFDLVYPTDADE